jgi:NitT/TauT family transport system substrate-binding protein
MASSRTSTRVTAGKTAGRPSRKSIRTAAVAVILVMVLAAVILSSVFLFHQGTGASGRIGLAVEFMNHAAAAYISQDKGWFEAEGLDLSAYTSYVTGMALASALGRGDIQVAYMCLVPAINAYANAGVPIKIVAGTHKYGYALVADPRTVAGVEDLAKDGVRMGCLREGGAVDMLLNRTIDTYGLDRDQVLAKVRRMNPPKLLIAIETGQIDAAFLPEQWASMAEDFGFRMLLSARDVWPEMQGSVLVVKEELIEASPGLVRKLVAVNEKATRWTNEHPEEAAVTLVKALSIAGQTVMPEEVAALTAKLDIPTETMRRSMRRLDYSTEISLAEVQEVIDYAARLGYIKAAFPAEEIVDTRFRR